MTWLGHENGCQLQSGLPCDCRLPGEEPCTCWESEETGPQGEVWAETNPECPLHGEAMPELRPADDPWVPICDGRDCGGRPHE